MDAILADLGFCSDQLADPQRGLSFQHDGPLDMRLDRRTANRPAPCFGVLRKNELAEIFWRFGEERHSRRIARKIVEVRTDMPLTTTGQLAGTGTQLCAQGNQAEASVRPGYASFPGLAHRGQ